MSWIRKITEFFVKDSAERRHFLNEFNARASLSFQTLLVGSLFKIEICSGNPDPSYRHDLSAPLFASGLIIKVINGEEIPIEDIRLIATIILLDESITRRMFVLHWDTLIVQDFRTGNKVSWKIKDFVSFGGLLY